MALRFSDITSWFIGFFSFCEHTKKPTNLSPNVFLHKKKTKNQQFTPCQPWVSHSGDRKCPASILLHWSVRSARENIQDKALGASSEKRHHADLRQDSHWQDHHPRSEALPYLAWSSFSSPPTHHPVRHPAVPLRPLNLPEIFYRLTARAAVRVESPAVGAAMEPLQLGVGIPSGCPIGAN